MDRNKELTKEEATNKINSQMPLATKVKKADIVIDNSGSKKQLEEKIVKEVIPSILQVIKVDVRS